MRKLFFLLIAVCATILMWYLFIKPYEFQISFTAKALPGTIEQTIKRWNGSLRNTKIINQKIGYSIEQEITEGKHTYVYHWKYSSVDDLTTRVNVYITEPGNSILNKILVPFTESEIERSSEIKVQNFYKVIKKLLANTGVNVEGISEIKGTYCVFIPLRTSQRGKASGMMKNYPLISAFVLENNIQTNGLPIVEITNWDIENDSISYNFCFPIIQTDSLPIHDVLKYKLLANTKAIKAVYNGNYITSDRAWYVLNQYARKHGMEINNTPIEQFSNNPNFGGNEKEWKADIFMPLK